MTLKKYAIVILLLSLFRFDNSFAERYLNSGEREEPQIDNIEILNDTLKIKALTDSCWKYRSNDPNKALQFGMRALSLIEETGINKDKPRILSFIGVVYRNIGDLDKALIYYYRSLDVSKQMKDSVQLGYSYENLSDYYYKKASYSIALENGLTAYQIFSKIDFDVGKAYALNNLGEIYLKQKNYEKALSYFSQAALLRKKNNDLRGYAKSLMGIAEVYVEIGDVKKGELNYKYALEISKRIGYKKGISSSLAGLSEIYYNIGDYKKALSKADSSLIIDKAILNKYGIIKNYNRLGLIYLKMNNFSKAKEYFLKAGELASESGHLDQEMLSYKNLAELFADKSEYKSSYEYFKLYMAHKDSIYSQEKMGKIADLQTTFEVQKKELENSILKKDVEYQKNLWKLSIAILIIAMLVIILIIAKYHTNQKANKLLTELNSSKDKFFSIIAHDLKNPFMGFLGYTELLYKDYDNLSEEDKKEAIQSMYKLSRNLLALLDGLLEWARAQAGRLEFTPTLFKLAEEAEKVIDLFKANAEEKGIALENKIDKSLPVYADRKMVNTVLRNLVANAIKFSNSGDSVRMTAEEGEKEVTVIVEDTGIGMSKEEIESLFRIDIHHTTLGTNKEAGTGVGLILSKELVQLNKGKIWVESELNKGSRFLFTLPKKKL